MKRIAIFIDGTWNRPDAPEPTNVVRLARCVRKSDDDGVVQHVLYSPGVGSGRGSTGIARWLDRLVGGALGWGLVDIIGDVYRDLVFAYEPGDELYVFGFSRGAFAARSLVGLIRSAGIAPPRHVARLGEAMERYAARVHPDDPKAWAFRADFAPETATSAREYTWRRKRGDAAIRLSVDYLGVWDTVGALGVPNFLPLADRINVGHAFHDTALSSMVLAARHAMALDERRATFPAHPWSNLDALSGERAEGERTHLQQWFPGDHGSVGGGGARIGLSSIALNWIALGAERAGLRLNWEEVDRLAWRFDIAEALSNKVGPVGVSGAALNALKRDRSGPATLEETSLAAVDRYHADAGYRPASLERVHAALYGLSGERLAALRRTIAARDGAETHRIGQFARPRPASVAAAARPVGPPP